MKAFNTLVVVAACVGLVLFLYYPDRMWLIIICEFIGTTILFFLVMRPVHEPDRAVVYRMATFHHIAGPGYIFLVPGFDHIEGVLDMAPRDMPTLDVPQVRTADNQYVRTNLDVTWRIHHDVNGRLNSKVKSMILMTEEQRTRLVEETVILMARQVVASYNLAQLNANVREAAGATMVDACNEILDDYGITVERVFWRGSPFPAKLIEARLAKSVAQEQTESLIATVEAIKKRLPDMQPEEFLALQAWLDTFRHGGLGGSSAPSH